MKSFALALFFCASLLAGLSIVLFPSTHAAENPLLGLLNLPAPPPPNPQVATDSTERPPDFFSKSKPPPDDAPIDMLMDYWRAQSQGYNDLGYKIYPSERVLDRLMNEIGKDPTKLGDFLYVFPRTDASSKFVKEIYEKMSGTQEGDRDRRSQVKRWMKYNTPYFSSELARDAARVTDVDDYVSNHRELIALARVDWNVAEPIVNRLYNNPGQKASRTAALWALYVHAMDGASVSDVDRYRDELKNIVADKSLGPGIRDLALDALSLEKEWSGRDEWYLSMMEDETLTDLGRFTGLTTLPGSSPEGKYIDRMIGLLDSNSIAVRSAAAQNLLDKIDWDREAIVKALARWLDNPKWLRETGRGGRLALIRALDQVKYPESVPGLIAALDEKQSVSLVAGYGRYGINGAAAAANAAATAMAMAVNSASIAVNSVNANFAGMPTNYYPFRHNAVEALAFQKDPRAVNALKRILNEGTTPYENSTYVSAIYECGGFTVTEQVAAVEKVAKASLEESQSQPTAVAINAPVKGRIVVEDYDVVDTAGYSTIDKDGMPITDASRLLGVLLVTRADVEDGLARGIIDRITVTEKSDPSLSNTLRKIIMRWKGPAVNAMLLRDLKRNKTDVDAIVRLLSDRKELREKQIDDISDLRTGSATAVGIASCLLEDPNDQQAILDGANDETKTALLACARLIRSPLPVQKVAENLQSKDKLLALAAERYLETEDSLEARHIVLSLHRNEAKILGASTAFFVDTNSVSSSEHLSQLFASVDPFHDALTMYEGPIERDQELLETETRLQAEVKKDADLLGIYNWRENFIRIYKDRAVLSWEKDPARYQERVLTAEEFEGFKGLLSNYKADHLPPFLGGCPDDECDSAQLLMLGRNGGRRLYVIAASMPPLFADLDRMFQELKQPRSVVKYWAAKDVPGLEVLFDDERLDALTVWKNGADFRLLTSDKTRQAMIENEIEAFAEKLADDTDSEVPEYGMDPRVSAEIARRRYENFSWNDFSNGTLGSAVAQPEQVEYLPLQDNLAVSRSDGSWKARAGSIEIRSDGKDLYKVVAGRLVKIAAGFFSLPVMTPNGRWVVVTKYGPEYGPQLVRINLLTNKQFVVTSEEMPAYRAVSYVPSVNRVLVGAFENRGEDYEGDNSDATAVEDGSGYSFLDPETGSLIRTRGEIRPLLQQTFRSLQPASNAFHFWVAVPGENETVIGIYNTRVFSIRPVLKIPKITFDSMNMWVDEAGSKAYFVYESQLLSVPIKLKP